MKIAFLARSLDYGGSERQLVELASGLTARGHEVRVGVFYPGGPLEKLLVERSIPVHHFRKKGRYETIRFLLRIRNWLRSFSPEIVHGYLIAPNLATAILKPFLRPARIVWGVRASFIDFDRYPRHEKWSFQAGRFFCRSADLVVVNSRAGYRHHIESGYPESRLRIVPNGVDTDTFRPDPEERDALRREWNIDRSVKLIGMVGRIDPMKGHERFLETAATLSEREPVRFVCIGSGPEGCERKMKSRAGELGLDGRLFWVPFRAGMVPVYNALDLLVSCSTGEGFPNVVAEAMACGTPAVVTDVGDSAEIVDGLGAVVHPGDPSEMAEVWRQVLNDPPEPALLRRSIQERYSLDRMVEETERLLLGLIDHG
jgi:glycosyltransferase involved in cell wall biosynthesis